jgi:hypothetical protein
MAAKPCWYGRLNEIVRELEALAFPWITRGTVEFLLGVGPRRAQQIMAPCAVEQIGTSYVADRHLLIQHLQSVAAGDAGCYENQRRRKLAHVIDGLRRTSLERPRILVEAPIAIVNQRLADLPAGIDLARGQITIRFSSSAEALQKMLALAMAIGRDMTGFEEVINGNDCLNREAPVSETSGAPSSSSSRT